MACMTIREFQKQINSILEYNKDIQLDTRITDCLVVQSDPKYQNPNGGVYPAGTVLFRCSDETGRNYIWAIEPERVSRWTM